MKKYLILILFCCFITTIFAQERKYYCEVICVGKVSGGENVYFDFGGITLTGVIKYKNGTKPVDDKGNEIKFNSHAEVLNWMAERGWNFEAVRYDSSGLTTTIYTFSKITSKEKIKDGIILKKEQ